MAKYEHKQNPKVNQIFNDLGEYLEFCKDYGYKFDENDLYSTRSYVWRQYQKFVTGKFFKDMWELDAKPRFNA
jgi:hypothetical protein